MIAILTDYFETMGDLILFFLRVIFYTPLAAAIAIAECAHEWERRARVWAGLAAIGFAVRVLPRRIALREQLLSLRAEIRRYERYFAWCLLTKKSPLIFESWKEESRWVHAKFRRLTPPEAA